MDRNKEQKQQYDESLKRNREAEDLTFKGIEVFLDDKKDTRKSSTDTPIPETKDEETIGTKNRPPRRSFWTSFREGWHDIAKTVLGTLIAALLLGACSFVWWQYNTIADLKRGVETVSNTIGNLQDKYDKENNFVSVEVIKTDLASIKDRLRLIETRVFGNRNQ